MNAIERIHNRITFLPKRDTELALKLLKDREFIMLDELVDSVIYKLNKTHKTSNDRRQYKDINLGNLRRLKSEIDVYLMQLEFPLDISTDCGITNIVY